MKKVAVIGIVGNSVFLPVEKFHVGGETVEASDVHFEPGGKGFNQAVAAARYGADVSFFAAVGAGDCQSIQAFLDKEGIDSVLVKKSTPTAFAAIITDASGSNRVTVYQGAQLDTADIALFEDKIKTADVLLLTNETAEEINDAAAKIAKANGVRVILNPAPSRKCCATLVENVDLFTPNEHETEGLDGYNLVITLGKKGCHISATDEHIPAVDVAPVVDTTGAGDTFNGVLAAELASGTDTGTAVRRANLASSISVTRKYAVSSIPTKETIDQYQKEGKDTSCNND